MAGAAPRARGRGVGPWLLPSRAWPGAPPRPDARALRLARAAPRGARDPAARPGGLVSPMTGVLYAANWKMHLGPTEAAEYVRRFTAQVPPSGARDLWFFPPAVSLPL